MRDPTGTGRMRGPSGRRGRGSAAAEEPLILCASGCRFPAGPRATGDEVACPLCGQTLVVGELFAERRVYVSRSVRSPRRLTRREHRRVFRAAAALLLVVTVGAVLWSWRASILESAPDVDGAALGEGRPG